jgi:protein PhnA
MFQVYPFTDEDPAHNILTCSTCLEQINHPEKMDQNHWRCLNDAVWSEADAVKVVSWRLLEILKSNGVDWAGDLQDMMYMEEEVDSWAKQQEDHEEVVKHFDSNGAVLSEGDGVTLIKDLDVKGANFTAKRGTAVRNIRLVSDNAEHIEGKVEGQRIVILTKFVKKL